MAQFKCKHCSTSFSDERDLVSEFLPSLVNAPENKWQFEHGGDDQEIPVDPDPVSDEQTYFAPCTVGKPRNPDMWKSLWHLIKKPFSKKESASDSNADFYLKQIPNLSFGPVSENIWETIQAEGLNEEANASEGSDWVMTELPLEPNDIEGLKRLDEKTMEKFNIFDISLKEEYNLKLTDLINYDEGKIFIVQPKNIKQSASDPEQEAIEQKELGGETLLEYSKGFKDLNRLDTNKPKTTWDNPNPRSGEPYSPLPVTLDTVTNENNENWRFPWRFTRRPVGEDYSDEGVVNEMLQEQEKRKACIKRITREITASYGVGYWIDPKGKVYKIRGEDDLVTHYDWIQRHQDLLIDEYQFTSERSLGSTDLISNGWTRIGDSNDGAIGVDTLDFRKISPKVDELLSGMDTRSGIDVSDVNDKLIQIPEWSGNIQKDVNRALSHKRLGKKASLPPQQFIPEHLNASTAIQTDDGSIYWSDEPHMIHVKLIKQLGIPVERIVSGGRIVDGDYHDLGPRSDTMRYVEQMLAKKRVEEKRKSMAKQAALEWNQRFFKYWKNENYDYLNDYDTLNNFLGQEAQNLPNKEVARLLYIHGEDLFNEKVRDLQSLGNQFPIYRVITVKDSDAFLKALESNKFEGFSGVGVYWSYDPSAAEAYWGKFESGYQKVQLTAIVHSSEIDWERTILANMNLSLGENEKEITLLDGAALQVNSIEIGGKVIQTSFPVTASLNKKAGSYSASVPDYQGEQYYNEQHMDNGGEVNYVNQDHVDNGYGFRDFNDSSTDYPKPEDISPAVVHLDILQKPFNRTDPAGIDWYQVQWYISAPMSQGIESVNPD